MTPSNLKRPSGLVYTLLPSRTTATGKSGASKLGPQETKASIVGLWHVSYRVQNTLYPQRRQGTPGDGGEPLANGTRRQKVHGRETPPTVYLNHPDGQSKYQIRVDGLEECRSGLNTRGNAVFGVYCRPSGRGKHGNAPNYTTLISFKLLSGVWFGFLTQEAGEAHRAKAGEPVRAIFSFAALHLREVLRVAAAGGHGRRQQHNHTSDVTAQDSEGTGGS